MLGLGDVTGSSDQEFSRQEPNLAPVTVLELSKIVAFRLRRPEQLDGLETAKEYERKTLAAELHDQTLMDLGGLAVELGFLGHKTSRYSEELELSVDQMRRRLKDTDGRLRDVVRGFTPRPLPSWG